jgi:plastocyanin
MNQRSLAISTRMLVILLGIIGTFNILTATTTLSPVFSTVSTSVDQGQLSEPSATDGSAGGLFQQIEQFLAPSGYQQAREDPSYAINIPFSDLGASPFEPSDISIPANMGVVWFNEDDSPQSVTFNDTSPEAIQPATIAPGGFFIHKFTTPGTYDYYNSENPSAKGRIKVGAEFEPGQNMNMLVGGDALPFEAGKVGRTTFSFVPSDNVTTIPPTLSLTFNVAIADSNGTQLYSNQFDDSDGILDLELIPTSSDRSSVSNQTGAAGGGANQTTGGGEAASSSNQTGDTGGAAAQSTHFVTWGPDLTDQEGVASDGAYHVQGPVMTENQDYTITVSITSIDDAVQSQPPSDDFTLPAANSTGNSLVPVEPAAGTG